MWTTSPQNGVAPCPSFDDIDDSPESVSPANSVLSHNLHDLKIEKINTGELKKANQKGFIAKILDAVFAFWETRGSETRR